MSLSWITCLWQMGRNANAARLSSGQSLMRALIAGQRKQTGGRENFPDFVRETQMGVSGI